MEAEELQARVDACQPWYHTLDLGQGVVTRGMFDHRGSEDRHGLPADLSGKRCLDVGTMDGYWAFAMERRHAAEVVAVDLDRAEEADWPARLRPKVDKAMDETKGDRFELARESLGSSVQRRLGSVYRLDPEELGLFDFVFCGDLLLHLKDPPTAVERIRAVCRGSAVITCPVKEHLPFRRRPLAQLDGVDEFLWWLPNGAALVRLMQAAGFERVELGPRFALPAVAGGPWKGRRRWVLGYV